MQVIRNVKLYCPDEMFEDMLFQQLKIYFQQKGKTIVSDFPCSSSNSLCISKDTFLKDLYADLMAEENFLTAMSKIQNLLHKEINENKEFGVLHFIMIDMANSKKFVVDFLTNTKSYSEFNNLNVISIPYGKYTTAFEVIENFDKLFSETFTC